MIPILPTAYFGSIAYFQELAKHPKVIIEAKEHFPKQTYRNRCDILAGDGILSLSIPTKRPNGNKSATDSILLSNEENWRIRHWRAIKSAYQSAAYFDYYGIEVEQLLTSDTSSLFELNLLITQRIQAWLDIPTTIESSTAFQPIEKDDPREYLVAKNSFHQTEAAPYIQVFPNELNFRKSLSILDAIFCEGPLARNLIIQ